MGVKALDHIQITGISNSGTTDGAGSWSTINLQTFFTGLGDPIPADATGIKFTIINNTTAGARWAGVRANGKTTAHYQADQAGGSNIEISVPFFAGNLNVDFYQESSDIQFRATLIYDGWWTFFDKDSALPTIASTASVFVTRTVSEVEANSTIIYSVTNGSRWRPTAETTNLTNTQTGETTAYVDASKQFQIASSAAAGVIAYSADGHGMTPSAWLTQSFTATADGTWRDVPLTVSGVAGIFAVDKSVSTYRYNFRKNGSSFAPSFASGMQSPDEGFTCGADGSGIVEYGVESGAGTPTIYLLGAMPDYEALVPDITSIDQLIEGQESTYALDGSLTVTGVTVSDGTYSAAATDVTAVDDENGTFTAPALTHGSEGPRLGAVTVTATDGVNTTDPFADTYSKTGYTTVILTSVSEFNYLAGFSPALKVGSQVAYDPTKGAIAADGVYSGTYEGSQVIWDHDPDDGIWRSANIFTSGGSVVPPGDIGIKMTGLTMSGITMRGL